MKYEVVMLVLVLVLVLAGCTNSVEKLDGDALIVLEGLTLVDGTGATPIPESVGVLHDDRIIKVGVVGQYSYPSDAVVRDVRAYGDSAIRNEAGNHSGEYVIPPVPKVIGEIESIRLKEDDGYYINGWACQIGVPDSLGVHIYADRSAYAKPPGIHVGSGLADYIAEPDIVKVCGSTGDAYRFHVRIFDDVLEEYQGRRLFVHGLRAISGTQNSRLAGNFDFPPSLIEEPRGCLRSEYTSESRNAYDTPYVRGQGSDFTYVAWVWRDTPDASSNHHLSVMRSTDLKRWENTCGEELSLPVGSDSATVLDPALKGEGLLNGQVKLSYDSTGNPIVAYQKYRYTYSREEPPKVDTQLYIARLVDGTWLTDKMTDWTAHYDFSGGGSLPSSSDKFSFGAVGITMDGRLYQSVRPATSDAEGMPRAGNYYINIDDDGHLSFSNDKYNSANDDPFLKGISGGLPVAATDLSEHHSDVTEIDWKMRHLWSTFDERWVSLRGDWNGNGSNEGGLFDRRQSAFFFRDGPATERVSFGSRYIALWPLIGDWGTDGRDSIGVHNPSSNGYFLKHTLTSGIADETYTGAVPENYSILDGQVRWHRRSPQRGYFIKYDTLPKNRDYPYSCNGTPLDGPDSKEWWGCQENFETRLSMWFYDDDGIWRESVIDETAWGGGYVAFGFIVFKDYQIVAYYDADRTVTVAIRQKGDKSWGTKRLDSQFVGWDSHNKLTLFVDEKHHIHLSGNLHTDPLNYWRSNGLNVESFARRTMVPHTREGETTYPRFFRGPDSKLLFKFRSGASGNGEWHLYIYDSYTQAWSHFNEGSPIFARN